MKKDGKKKRLLTREDLLLWRKVTEKDTPLPGKDRPLVPEELYPNHEEPDVTEESFFPSSVKSTENFQSPFADTAFCTPLNPGDTHRLDKNTADRVRRGKYPIDRRVDLHGMTQAKAHHAVREAVLTAESKGQRLLLIITGKGGRTPGSEGVLRKELPRWLNEDKLKGMIVAVFPAIQAHGGSGAFYVLIRRRRKQ